MKQLRGFCSSNDLILSQTILKKYCSTDKRGKYNLSGCGLDIPEEEKQSEGLEDFLNVENDTLGDVSSFVERKSVKNVMKKALKTEYNINKDMANPIYVVMNDNEVTIRGVCDNFDSAWKLVDQVLHAIPSVSKEEARAHLEKYCFVYLNSNNVRKLVASITVRDLNIK